MHLLEMPTARVSRRGRLGVPVEGIANNVRTAEPRVRDLGRHRQPHEPPGTSDGPPRVPARWLTC